MIFYISKKEKKKERIFGVLSSLQMFDSYTCLSLSAVALPESKSTVLFEVRSGFSRIFSMMKSMTAIIASTLPVIRHTLSVVPVTNRWKDYLRYF